MPPTECARCRAGTRAVGRTVDVDFANQTTDANLAAEEVEVSFSCQIRKLIVVATGNLRAWVKKTNCPGYRTRAGLDLDLTDTRLVEARSTDQTGEVHCRDFTSEVVVR